MDFVIQYSLGARGESDKQGCAIERQRVNCNNVAAPLPSGGPTHLYDGILAPAVYWQSVCCTGQTLCIGFFFVKGTRIRKVCITVYMYMVGEIQI